MSHKFGNCCRGLGILALLPLLLCLNGCRDACRQLAEQVCNCRETSEERRQCITDLSLASQHEYFKLAKEPEVCERGLTECPSCEDLNKGKDHKCGMYRLAK